MYAPSWISRLTLVLFVLPPSVVTNKIKTFKVPQVLLVVAL